MALSVEEQLNMRVNGDQNGKKLFSLEDLFDLQEDDIEENVFETLQENQNLQMVAQ